MWRLRHCQPPRILRGSVAGRSDLISYIKSHNPCGPSVTSLRLLPLPSTTSFGYSLQFDLPLWTPRCSTPLKFGINLNDLMIWRPIIPSPSSGGNSALPDCSHRLWRISEPSNGSQAMDAEAENTDLQPPGDQSIRNYNSFF